MKGLILAAGMGARLMPLTTDRPKALMNIGGTTLLGRIIDQCAEVGMDEVIVVTGYRSDTLGSWLDRTPSEIPVRTVFNSEFETTNNAHSVFVARDAIGKSDFIKMDGDLVLDTGILRHLVQDSLPSVAVIDLGAARDIEAMKAKISDTGQILAFGKWLEIDEAQGESIGVEKIGAADADLLFESIERVVYREGRTDACYEDVYHVMLEEHGWQMGSIGVEGRLWSEVDNATDLEYARSCHKILQSGKEASQSQHRG
ncbi:MAG: phosphocholine cytidylyltransferase family protein [Myxococcota bacterium]|nr:phosphocholine cytidylyltransferase family protein [Myxococcota bacterium]